VCRRATLQRGGKQRKWQRERVISGKCGTLAARTQRAGPAGGGNAGHANAGGGGNTDRGRCRCRCKGVISLRGFKSAQMTAVQVEIGGVQGQQPPVSHPIGFSQYRQYDMDCPDCCKVNEEHVVGACHGAAGLILVSFGSNQDIIR